MSDKIRIYKLAKDLDLDYKDILKEAKDLGIEAKSHASTVTPDEAEIISESLKEQEIVEDEEKETQDSSEEQEPEEETADKQEQDFDGEILNIKPGITTEELAEQISMDVDELIEKYGEKEIVITASQRVNPKDAKKVLKDLGYRVQVEEFAGSGEDIERTNYKPRAPVVTVMGHVDHGKTQLLDTIRNTKVVAGERGGITQHIGASKVKVDDKGEIVFIDTPGHEAFTAMRARGAQITDLVILVIAGDDGVMPQTVEAINHARAAGVPMIIAINKKDLPAYNAENVKTQLSQHNVLTEDWGGDIIAVEISAIENENIDELLEMVLLQAEMLELTAPVDGPARGLVIESELDKRMGPTGTVLVTEGTLRTKDAFICGSSPGKIKAMTDSSGQRVKEAPPSTPVKILGFDEFPNTGDTFEVVEDRTVARKLAEERKELLEKGKRTEKEGFTLEDFQKQVMADETKELKLVLKADVSGSLEAIKDAVRKLETDEVSLDIIHASVGGVTKKDIMLASASDAVIMGFNISASGSIKKEAEREGIQIRTYRVIYEIIEDIKKALEGLLEPEEKEVTLGRAQVKKIFNISGVGTIAGCKVISGVIKRSGSIRVLRDSRIVYEGELESLKRFQDDVSEVDEGYECGMSVENFNDIKTGDILESFEIRTRKRTLS
ncbi:MAG: translation initiation factor IF-2 [Elusimicrobiota bacterium]